MTYEQAVAKAFLNILHDVRVEYNYPPPWLHCDYEAEVYAVRRLRVRAGLMP